MAELIMHIAGAVALGGILLAALKWDNQTVFAVGAAFEASGTNPGNGISIPPVESTHSQFN